MSAQRLLRNKFGAKSESPKVHSKNLASENIANGNYLAKSGPDSDALVEDGPLPLVPDEGIQRCLKIIKLKDGGYSWVVLVAMVMSNVLTAGYVKSFGLTYNIILSQYPDTSGTISGVMMGLLSGCRAMLAPLAGAFNIAYGERACIVFGTVMCVFGQGLSFYCTAVWQLSITMGAMMGIGLCFIESCQVVIINNYFDTRLSLANGIRVCGNPMGGIVFPFLLIFLLEIFGNHLITVVMAGFFLHLMVITALVRPYDINKRIEILRAMKTVSTEAKMMSYDKETYEVICKLLPDSRKPKTNGKLEFRFLKNAVYMIFVIMAIFFPLAFPLVIYYIPIYALTVGLTPVQNSILMGFQSVADLFFRLSLGCLANLRLCKKVHGFSFSLVLGGLGAMAIPLCSDLWSLLCSTSLFSVGGAGFFVYLNVVLSDQFGKSSIASTWGFVRLVQGAFAFINPSLIGFLVDYTGGFTIPFIVMGSGMLLAAFLLCLQPCVIKMTNSDVVIT